MLKNIIRSFLPWILYFAISGNTQLQLDIAIIVAATTSIIFELNELKKGFILSWGTLIFFIFMFITVVLFKNQWLAKHAWFFSNSALALIAWISILVRRPFTIQYAKEQVSEDKWQHPLFIKINYILSSIWGLIFLINLGVNIIQTYNIEYRGWAYELTSYIPSIFGIWFTAWFPNWYKEKYIREHAHEE